MDAGVLAALAALIGAIAGLISEVRRWRTRTGKPKQTPRRRNKKLQD
jgi:hypothetical protein